MSIYGPFPQVMVDAANEQLDKLGFEVIPIPYEKVIPFGGALPFLIPVLIVAVLVVVFPDLALWLPRVFYGR